MEAPIIKYAPYLQTATEKWPVLTVKAPYLLPAQQGYEKISVSLNIRLPMLLDSTIDLHSKTMGTSKSAWVRRAMLHLLSLEQQWLDQQKKV